MKKARDDATKAVTVRIPEREYWLLKDYSDRSGQSLNMIVSDAIAEETSKLRRLAALNEIAEFQSRFTKLYEATSVEDIRNARVERAKKLVPDKRKEESDR